MTFRKEISLDGVAIIVACVLAVSYVTTLKVEQDALKNRVDKDEVNITSMQATESSVASSLAVLTAIVNVKENLHEMSNTGTRPQ